MKGPDFIGLGAQKSGTSWIYACLHEHPQICIPRKEIHFFSRERNWLKGYDWYIDTFSDCRADFKVGEFSTSYLEDEGTPERIYARFPHAKLIISLRHPIDRAYSNYINDVKTGAIPSGISFLEALDKHPEYMGRGKYADQLLRYLDYFKFEQMLILIYEDSLKDPEKYIKKIYKFLNVDDTFTPDFIRTKINFARIPRHIWIDTSLRKVSSFLRLHGFDGLFWKIKRSGIAEKIRGLNTRRQAEHSNMDLKTRKLLYERFSLQSEIAAVSKIIGRDLPEWRI